MYVRPRVDLEQTMRQERPGAGLIGLSQFPRKEKSYKHPSQSHSQLGDKLKTVRVLRNVIGQWDHERGRLPTFTLLIQSARDWCWGPGTVYQTERSRNQWSM